MMAPGGETVNILLIDDDEADRESVERSFKKHKIANPLFTAEGGLEGLEMLRGNGTRPMPRPYLVLLDLNMPGMNGIEFLEELRKDPKISDSIVFVLTTSDDDKDKLAAYEKHVAGYVVKSSAGTDFINLINMLDLYWRYVEFPPAQAA